MVPNICLLILSTGVTIALIAVSLWLLRPLITAYWPPKKSPPTQEQPSVAPTGMSDTPEGREDLVKRLVRLRNNAANKDMVDINGGESYDTDRRKQRVSLTSSLGGQ